MNLKQTISLFCLLIGINNGLAAMEASSAQVQALEGGIEALNQRLHRFEQAAGDLPKTKDSSEETVKAAELFKKQMAKELQDQLETAKTDATQSREEVKTVTHKLYLILGSSAFTTLALLGTFYLMTKGKQLEIQANAASKILSACAALAHPSVDIDTRQRIYAILLSPDKS